MFVLQKKLTLIALKEKVDKVSIPRKWVKFKANKRINIRLILILLMQSRKKGQILSH